MSDAATRLPAALYTAVVKPTVARKSTRKQAGVVLVLSPPGMEEPEQAFAFPSWRFLRQHLLVFGFASPAELDTADVRLSTGRQPYMFSPRRWEAPLIEALNLHQ